MKRISIKTGESKDRSDMIAAICKFRGLDLKKTKEMLEIKTMTSIQHIIDLCKQEKLSISINYATQDLSVELEEIKAKDELPGGINPADHVNVQEEVFEAVKTSENETTGDSDEEDESDEDPFI